MRSNLLFNVSFSLKLATRRINLSTHCLSSAYSLLLACECTKRDSEPTSTLSNSTSCSVSFLTLKKVPISPNEKGKLKIIQVTARKTQTSETTLMTVRLLVPKCSHLNDTITTKHSISLSTDLNSAASCSLVGEASCFRSVSISSRLRITSASAAVRLRRSCDNPWAYDRN